MTDISELDFARLKENLKTFLSSQTRFQDYDFEGSNMSVLLDVLAYNTYQNNFYANMLFGEMFLDSAQLDESVRSHAKHLNYLPRSRRSAKATCTVTFSANDAPARITIPKFQPFTGRGDNNETFIFSTSNSHIVEPVNGIYTVSNVEIFEGRVMSERFPVTANTDQSFAISNKNADTSSIEVTVFDTDANNSNSSVYVYHSDIFGVSPTDKVFYLSPKGTDYYQVRFGRDIFGKQPTVGNVVQIRYRLSSGEDANGVDTFTVPAIDGYAATISNVAPAAGGAERETVSEIKFFAPKALQVQERAITTSDYTVLLKQRFPEITSVSAFGGEEMSPPQFGKAIIVVKIDGQDYITENQRAQFAEYLRERAPITIEPVIEVASDMYLYVSGVVTIDQSATNRSPSQIKTDVIAKILQFSTNNLERFDAKYRHSKFISAIDSVEPAIASSALIVKPIIELVPALDQDVSATLNFGNALKQTHPIYAGENLHTRTTAIRSSKFTTNGRETFLIDDGLGRLKIFSALSDGTFATIRDNAGTVDYDTGTVEISALNVSAHDGTAIKFYALTHDVDISTPRKKVLSIRSEDINIAVNK